MSSVSRYSNEIRRILKGKLQGPKEFTRITGLLWLTAGMLFWICWMLHPQNCDFSIINDTISHFGKPDNHGTSLGFIAFHMGFAALCIFMFIAVKYRDRQLSGLPGPSTQLATAFYTAGILGLVLSLVFPDSKQLTFYGLRYRKLHGLVVVIGIVCFVTAILGDTRKLWQLFSTKKQDIVTPTPKFLPKRLLPTAVLASIFMTGLIFIGIWEIRCMRDASLDHWPGEGIFSAALWEWILFTYLIVFMYWYTRSLAYTLISRGGITGIKRWRISSE